MNLKYISSSILVIGVIVGWNAFLIQRDNALYDVQYHQQALENLKRPPTSEIR